MGFSYQKNFSNPTLPVDEAQFYALVRASKWNENIDKYRETHDAALKRKLPAFIFQATFDETTSKAGMAKGVARTIRPLHTGRGKGRVCPLGLHHALWSWFENRLQGRRSEG